MNGWVVFLLLSWGIQGGGGVNALPQAKTDSTSQVAFSPFFQISFVDFVPGFQLHGSWRGLYEDTLRTSRASSRLLTGYLSYNKPGFPLFLRIGRHFCFLGMGGLIDGLTARLSLKRLSLDVLSGKRAPSLYSSEEKFFGREAQNLIAFQLAASFMRHIKFYVGYGREFRNDTVSQAPLWVSFSWQRKVRLRGQIYYDMEEKVLSRASFTEYGRTGRFLWSLGYRYLNPWYAFRSLGFEDDDDLSSLSRPLHRIEGSLRVFGLPLRTSLGGWFALPKGKTYTNLWIRLFLKCFSFYGWMGKEEEDWQRGGELSLNLTLLKGLTAFITGRLIDEPRWPNIWVESLRFGVRCLFPFGGSIKGELRLWANPEVERETQAYLGLFLPFNWRSGG